MSNPQTLHIQGGQGIARGPSELPGYQDQPYQQTLGLIERPCVSESGQKAHPDDSHTLKNMQKYTLHVESGG